MHADLSARHISFASYGITDGYTADAVSDFLPTKAELEKLLSFHPWREFWPDYYDHQVEPFFKSIASGVRATESETKKWAATCPDSEIVLAGYSQGAMAVHEAEHDLRFASRSALGHVAATILLGDGDREPGTKAKLFGSASDNAQGILDYGESSGLVHGTRSDVPLPGSTAEICNADDIVCDFGQGWLDDFAAGVLLGGWKGGVAALTVAVKHAVKVHVSYVRDTAESVTWTDPALISAAKWAAGLVARNLRELPIGEPGVSR
jgi:hypothetical protein